MVEPREMLKALYNFKATFAKTLSFRENDFFIMDTDTKQRNWWQVINARGQIGYVPSNYVASIEVGVECWMEFLDGCLAHIQSELSQSGVSMTTERKELIQRLLEHRRRAEPIPSGKRQSPKPPSTTLSNTSINTYVSSIGDASELALSPQHRSSESQPPRHSVEGTRPEQIHPTGDLEQGGVRTTKRARGLGRGGSSPNAFSRASSSNSWGSDMLPASSSNSGTASAGTVTSPTLPLRGSSTTEIGSEKVYHLVEQVRLHTQLSHELSRVAVMVVVSQLHDTLPPEVAPHLAPLLAQLQGPIVTPQLVIEDTHDARRLHIIFNELTSCKEDSQQRSWMLYEDEATIIEYIKELTSILANADAMISRHIMSKEQYNGVSSMVQYYQMEVRWSIRQLLLQAFGIMCSLDATVVTLLLNSVLPSELARDMCSNDQDVLKLKYSALLLTMIFSMGEPMPVTHLDHLGTEFVTFLLNMIESSPNSDMEDLPDLFLNLLFSYNLQFTSTADNIVLEALMQMSVAKTFTEKILVLFNREEDPVRVFEHKPAPPHSVLKLFVDLFSTDRTANLFYTNDTMVLIDIVVRQLADLSPGDKRRQQYLRLCQLVMRNTAYAEHHHRRDDLLKTFTRIFCEESELSRVDQQLVRDISNEFPQHFKS